MSDQDPASDEDDEDNEAGPSNNTNGELINVDFEFFDPTEGDYHGIKVLLNGLLDGQPFATAPLADFILQQVCALGGCSIDVEGALGVVCVVQCIHLLPPSGDAHRKRWGL